MWLGLAVSIKREDVVILTDADNLSGESDQL
jgi:hypothetical protein